MAERSLFKIVDESQNSEDNKGKRLVGYTVSSYKGVLSALEKAKQYQKQDGTSSAAPVTGQIVREVNYSILGETGLDQDEEVGGFIKNQYQGLCIYKDFMSFVIDYKSSDGKMFTKYVSVNKNDDQNKHLSSGIGCIGGGKPIFPMTVKKEASYYSGLDSDTSTFKIGVGIDISNFGVKFFKFFFPNIEWDESKLKTLAAKECLFAEVLMPLNATSNTAKVLHAMVIADVKDYQGCPFQVHIPNPLLLLSDYSKIGSVVVNCSENSGSKEVAVGDGNVTNPLSAKLYYHKDASIDGFTPQYVETFAKNENGGGVVSYVRTTLQSGNTQTKGRVRLFFDPKKESEIVSVLGSIPSEYNKELFQGKLSENQIVKTKIIIESAASFGIGMVGDFWENVGQMLTNKLTGAQVEQAVSVAAKWESGNKGWGAWEICGTGNGDGEGVSAGKFQFTQRAGGIKIYKEKFKARGGQMSEEMAKAIDSSKGGTKSKITREEAKLLLACANEFAQQASTKEGQLAQCDVWLQEKGKTTIEWYDKLNCKTPAEFVAIFGGVNHYPAITSIYSQYKGELSGITDAYERAKFLENLHWVAVEKYGYERTVSPSQINASHIRGMSSTYGKGWSDRYTDSLNQYKSLV